MKTVFTLLAAMSLTLLACSKDEPADGGKMAPTQAMAPTGAMAPPGAMAAPGTMAAGSAMKPAPGAGHM